MTRPILWTPSAERADASTMAGFIRFLEARGLHFDALVMLGSRAEDRRWVEYLASAIR